eukprot:CAMPEP_0194360914 /NCGR_PEP_ID=MMETSP0174-20130528/8368_1 /TAXON_ID=216777 /ORGANISM="Proboscia alata, Strain PI-D3" /LENGTH=54 /DNA_ID=CAMNT_0039132733 /DNA_START=152 /DNA_END=316 /DNA_ORIENTATION=-
MYSSSLSSSSEEEDDVFTRLLGDLFSRREEDPDATLKDGTKSAMTAVDDDDSIL